MQRQFQNVMTSLAKCMGSLCIGDVYRACFAYSTGSLYVRQCLLALLGRTLALITNHLSSSYHRRLLSSAPSPLAISSAVYILLAHLPLSSLSSFYVSLPYCMSASPPVPRLPLSMASARSPGIRRTTQLVVSSGSGDQSTSQSVRQRTGQTSSYVGPSLVATSLVDVASVSARSSLLDNIGARW